MDENFRFLINVSCGRTRHSVLRLLEDIFRYIVAAYCFTTRGVDCGRKSPEIRMGDMESCVVLGLSLRILEEM